MSSNIIFLVMQTTKLQHWGDSEPSYYTNVRGAFATEALALAFIDNAPTSHTDEEQEVDITYTYDLQSWTIQDGL